MSSNILEYKGYWTDIEIDFESRLFHGHLEGIKDFVNFESEISRGVEGIIFEFHSAVDDYLEFCREMGTAPNVPEMPQELAI
ncbi:MAG: hypothetical protein IJL18_07175 [Synergistaceae bacterium]|nr:hypothetical protein [Synergistaceae bacterium]